MKISNSKAQTWRRCPKQFHYKYVERVEPRAKALPLERGSWIHELLQTHYDGEDWKGLHRVKTQQFYDMPEEVREDLGELPTECYRIMTAYLRHWAKQDEHLVVVDTELNEYVDLGNGLKLNVVIDLITEDQRGRLTAWDHKSRKNFERTDNMLLDPQLTLYFRALEIMGYKPLVGVGYNEIRTKPPTVPHLLKNGSLSKSMNIDTDVATYYREIRRHHLDPDHYADILRHLAKQPERFFRRTLLPKDLPMVRTMTKEVVQTARQIARAEAHDEYPRTFIPHDCKWSCAYLNLCIAELHGADISSMIKLQYRRRKRVD